MPEHPALGPRPHQPGPEGSRLDAVERLRRQLEALDSRGKSRGRKSTSRATSDPWAPTSRWDEGNSKEAATPWDSGSSADESARTATNAKHIADAWAGADSPEPDDGWDTTGSRAATDPWAPTSNDAAANPEEDTPARDLADPRLGNSGAAASPRATRSGDDSSSATGSAGDSRSAVPNAQRAQGRTSTSGRRQPFGQRDEASPGVADGSVTEPRPGNRQSSSGRSSSADGENDSDQAPTRGQRGWPWDDDSSDEDSGGRGRRGRRRGSSWRGGDSAGEGESPRDDDSRDGGRPRKARRLPGEPLPDGGTEIAAKDACLRLLTDRARSRAELADRLATKGFSPEIANRALDRLTEVGLIDDAAFAQQWVYSRHTYSGKGKKALAQELRRKGVPQEDADEALSTITPDDELSRATDLVRRKIRSLPSGLDRDKATRRLVGMLARRGYNPGTAYTVVKAELAGAGSFSGDSGDFSEDD